VRRGSVTGDGLGCRRRLVLQAETCAHKLCARVCSEREQPV
jgi:hypothetical protein